jgi:hypothetical protein
VLYLWPSHNYTLHVIGTSCLKFIYTVNKQEIYSCKIAFRKYLLNNIKSFTSQISQPLIGNLIWCFIQALADSKTGFGNIDVRKAAVQLVMVRYWDIQTHGKMQLDIYIAKIHLD